MYTVTHSDGTIYESESEITKTYDPTDASGNRVRKLTENEQRDKNAKNKASIEAYMGMKKGGSNKTRKNKQEGGKRKLSEYMKFANKVRPQLMKENPGMKVPELGKRIGKMWRDQK
jgi:hypothetical protein